MFVNHGDISSPSPSVCLSVCLTDNYSRTQRESSAFISLALFVRGSRLSTDTRNMFHIKFSLTLLLLLLCSLSSANRWYRMFNSNHDDPCVDRHKRFQRCIPDFINAAYQKPIYVSSACSSTPKDFCSLSSSNANQLTDYLTDMNNPNNLTCWQSDPIKAGGNISLVLSLKKKFELTYISLQFCSATKPDSMAIYKSMDMVSTPAAELISRLSCSRP